ncbi:MAG: S9 family peptidase [Bacteroidetes bacterium]|nr:S9 family peptidase [Bacteroidota bacterium]
MKNLFILITTALTLVVSDMTSQELKYPETKKTNQIDDYFGTKINDPYRWLENDTSKETANWVSEQNNVTNQYFSKITFRKKIHDRLTELWNYPKQSGLYKIGDWYALWKNNGLQNQWVLYVQKGINGEPEVFLDPNKLSNDGTIAIQANSFSKTQKYFAYATSSSGSDWQEIYVMSFANKTLLADKIEHVKFTGISWLGDEGFYYSGYDKPLNEKTKYSAKSEYQKIFFHKIGTAQSEDKLIYEDKEHPLRYVGAGLTEDERFLILQISEGTDGSEIKLKDLLNKNSNEFITLVEGFNINASIINNIGDQLLLYTNKDAPNYKLVGIDTKHFENKNWKTLINEKSERLDAVSTGGGKIFASYLKDANTTVEQYNNDGRFERKINLPGLGTANGFGCKKNENEFYYNFTSYIYPNTIFKYDIKTGESILYKTPDIKFNPNDYESKQVFYSGKDGTKIPLFITYKKGLKLNGNNPTLLYAYGGFNINITPAFSVSNLLFLEKGGIYCVANIRGGGEYGENWHKAGMLKNKQNVFNDFISAAEYLIKEKYTNQKMLAISGRSNGGLLVGACLTQRPDLFKVALPQVGVLDMLRYHKFTVGWGWAVEYGSSENKEQFNYLIKYSPLHNIKQNTCYPATLIVTADHDDRVVPAHSFKFAATLQPAQSCKNPVLIRIESKAGHGAGKPTAKVIDEITDIWSFVFYNFGIEY